MQLTITIPDNRATQVINAVALSNGWTPENPLTKPQFVKKVIMDSIKAMYVRHEASQAAQAASAASNAQTQTLEIT